jgi:hypothetical protein
MTDPRHDLSAEKARQASTPGIVRYVLAASLTLVIIGFALAWLFS